MDRQQRDTIIDYLNPKLASLGYSCLEVEWDGADQTLRIFIDQADGKIDMDDCLKVNELLIEDVHLDTLVPGDYRLEISSPGVERPLRLLEHFQSAVGKTIKVHLSEKHQERANGVGKLESIAEDKTFTMLMPSGPWTFPFSAIRKANLVFEWR